MPEVVLVLPELVLPELVLPEIPELLVLPEVVPPELVLLLGLPELALVLPELALVLPELLLPPLDELDSEDELGSVIPHAHKPKPTNTLETRNRARFIRQ
jgi:hypothetical protein